MRPAIDLNFAASKGFDPRLTFTRTSGATRLQQSGVWREVPAGTPRLHHDTSGKALGMLLEPSRVQNNWNPRAEGSVAGTPGTLPTYWTTSLVSGLTRTIVGTGTEDGIPYIDIQFAGTAGASGTVQVVQNVNNQAAALTGQTWTASWYVTLQAGSLPGSGSITILERDGGGTLVTFESITVSIAAGRLREARKTVTRTLSGGASVALVMQRLDVGVTNGAVVDFTLRLAMPGLEQGFYATTPILPAVGAPGETTRAIDSCVINLTDFGLPIGLQQGTLLVSGRMAPGVDSLAQRAVYMDDGTGAAEYIYIGRGTSKYHYAAIQAASASQASISGPSAPDKADAILALAWAANDVMFCCNGALQAADTAAVMPASLSRMAIGGTASGSGSWGGTIARVAFWPQRLSNATIQALTVQ